MFNQCRDVQNVAQGPESMVGVMRAVANGHSVTAVENPQLLEPQPYTPTQSKAIYASVIGALSAMSGGGGSLVPRKPVENPTVRVPDGAYEPVMRCSKCSNWFYSPVAGEGLTMTACRCWLAVADEPWPSRPEGVRGEQAEDGGVRPDAEV